MRVLIINTSERIGGAAIAANRLMQALKKNGVKARMLVRDKQTDQLTVVSIGYGWTQPIKFLWERVSIFAANKFSKRNLFLVDIANAGTDITKNIEFERADVIHLHWVNQGYLSIKNLNKILHSGKRVVITMHDQWYFTGICHYSGDCDKYTFHCHHCTLMNGTALGDFASQLFDKKQHIYEDSKVTFVGCSQWMANLARTSALTQGHKVVSIPNAINTEQFRPLDKTAARKELSLPLKGKLLLFGCQRITDERKGFRYLVDALQIIKRDNPEIAQNTEIVVVGGKADSISSHLPFSIIPVSYVSDPPKMIALYNAVDLYVTPSLQDNLPNTIMEALACGTPCVGFDVGGIPEMIDHKKNGYVARYKDSADFAEGIKWVLTSDHDTLSAKAREKVMNNYTEDIVAKKYIEVYED